MIMYARELSVCCETFGHSSGLFVCCVPGWNKYVRPRPQVITLATEDGIFSVERRYSRHEEARGMSYRDGSSGR